MVDGSSGAFVRSINISERKGTRKTPVGTQRQRVREQWGFEKDAHAGDWHRQVSFLGQESIERAQGMGLDVKEGDFGENFTTEGIDLLALPLGTTTRSEERRVGKECRSRWSPYH